MKTFLVKQKFRLGGERIDIKDDRGVVNYQVEGSFFQIPKTFTIYDAYGEQVSEISKELRLFSFVIETKYAQMDFDFVFCFRALYTTRGIRSKVRFEKDCNYLGVDLIIYEEEFYPYKNYGSMQRRIMGKHFFPFFAENIKKYRNKLPVLKPIEKDLVEDMRLFLIENLWLPDDSGSFKLSVIENVSYDRAMALFGKPKQKRFTDTDNGKMQDILWEVDEQTKLSAQYRLIDKVWTLECYNIE